MTRDRPDAEQERPQVQPQSRKVSPSRPSLTASNHCSFEFATKRITYTPNEVYVKDSNNQEAFAGTMASDPAPAHASPNYNYNTQSHDVQEDEAQTDSLANFPGLSNREAEDALNRFRLRKVKYFPFVHIPDSRVSAYRLRQTQPLLWLSIMACATHSAELQDRLCLRLRQEIAQQAIVQHQRSLDLLLGIVGFLGWGMYYLKRDPFMVMYCHIATAIVQDLGLDKDPPAPKTQPQQQPTPHTSASSGPATDPSASASNTPGSSAVTPVEHPLSCVRTHGFAIKLLESPVRTMEERRAVLGTYLITVLVSLFHRKPISLPWTDHMDECLRVLDADPETPLDRLLVYQCRLQRIALDIPNPQGFASIKSAREMRMLRDFQVKALVSRQRDVEAMMPPFDDEPDLKEICTVANIANEAAIYSVALYVTNLPTEERARCGPDTERAALLHKCLRLHHAYFDMAFARKDTFSLERDSFFYMFSFHTVTQMSYFLVVIYRLASFGRDDPGCGWDKDWARAQLDIPDMVDTLTKRFSEAATHFSSTVNTSDTVVAPPSDTQSDFFSRSARAMDLLRTTWMTTWAKESPGFTERNQDQGPELTPADNVFSPPIDFTPESAANPGDGFLMGSSMSAWMSDMFTDWQMQY